MSATRIDSVAVVAIIRNTEGSAFGIQLTLIFFFDSAAICMVATDTLENHRSANRRVANVVACKTSTESPDAEVKRSKAATVVNALAMLRLTAAPRA